MEPLVSLDLEIAVATKDIRQVCELVAQTFTIERFSQNVNLTSHKSDLRIQLQTDPRYQKSFGKATAKEVLGYTMRVASLEDALRGKLWAYSDVERPGSKRQKHPADIARMVEAYPQLKTGFPENVRRMLERR